MNSIRLVLGGDWDEMLLQSNLNRQRIRWIFRESVFIAYPEHPQNLLVPSPSNYRSYYETRRFNQFNETIWSMTGGSGFTGDDVVNEAIKLATAKTNITGFVMDDFFIGETRLSTDDLDSIRARIPRELGWSNPNLWVVLYDDELNRLSYDSYLKRFDYITFWTKDSDNLSKLPEKFGNIRSQSFWIYEPSQNSLGLLYVGLSKPHESSTPTQENAAGQNAFSTGKSAGMVEEWKN